MAVGANIQETLRNDDPCPNKPESKKKKKRRNRRRRRRIMKQFCKPAMQRLEAECEKIRLRNGKAPDFWETRLRNKCRPET